MSPQVHTTEVNTKIPSREFFNRSFPWYRERSCIDGPQTEARASTFILGGQLTHWVGAGHFHLNEEDPIPVVLFPYIDDPLEIHSVNSSTNRLENFVAEKMFAIPEVEYVSLSLENDSIDVWTVINKLDTEVRKKIYDLEYDILDILKGLQFDFHVICRNDRNITELYPSNARMIIQK